MVQLTVNRNATTADASTSSSALHAATKGMKLLLRA